MKNSKLKIIGISIIIGNCVPVLPILGLPYDHDQMAINEINNSLPPGTPKVNQGLKIINDEPKNSHGIQKFAKSPIRKLVHDLREANNARNAYEVIVAQSSPYTAEFWQDTKNSPSEVPLTFSYKGLKKNNIPAEYLGADEGGVQTQDGKYTSSVEILKHSKLGACKYIVSDFKTARAGITYKQSELTKEVNGKYTWVWLAGDENIGIKVAVDWYDDEVWHSLNCSVINNSEDLVPTAIDFARTLDSNHEV